jgi:glycosyltransferase involved in cell wall biosynthesis
VNADARSKLNIGMVGGIFGHPPEYQSEVLWTPETMLLEGLRERGHNVRAMGHSERFDVTDFDVVHVHHLSWGAMRAATSSGSTPFVFTLHQSSTSHPRVARFVMARADGIVALWPQEADALGRIHRLDGVGIRVIPNGVDPTAFPFRAPAQPRDRPWRLLFVGQLIRAKGVDLLLEALVDVRRRHDLVLDLTYHAANEEDLLRARSSQLGLEDVVRFVGSIPQAELSARYLAADIAVLPSRRGEALPSALTEAMLSGRCPVATDVGGVRDQLGEFGVVVDEATPEAIADGIERAIETFEQHRRRAVEMRRYAEERFSPAAMVSAHEALYTSLVDLGKRPRRARGARRVGTVLARAPLRLSGHS